MRRISLSGLVLQRLIRLAAVRVSAHRSDSRPSRGNQPSCFVQVIRELSFFYSPRHSFCRFDMIIAALPPAQRGTHHPPGASRANRSANGLVLEPLAGRCLRVKRTRNTSALISLSVTYYSRLSFGSPLFDWCKLTGPFCACGLMGSDTSTEPWESRGMSSPL